MNDKLERHHWTPCSIYGITHGSNIIPVGHDLHIVIHKAMNYKYRMFTRMWRTFRIRHNHKSAFDDSMARDILRMQQGYLDRWVNLPKVAQTMHFQKMNELTLHYNPHYRWDKNWRFLWSKYEKSFKAFYL